MKIAVVTDSGSGIEKSEIDNLFIIGMPFMIDGKEYFEGVNISKREFFDIIEANKSVTLSTSQPSLYNVTKLWDKILEKFDAIIHITLSSALSASYTQAYNMSMVEYKGKVFVPNPKTVSVTQVGSVEMALDMIKEGFLPEEICEHVEKCGADSSIYIMVDTLDFLKKGGRVTPSAAALGNLLRIKPVLQIQGGKLDSYKKVISSNVAKKVMINAIEDDLNGRFKKLRESGQLKIAIAHADDLEGAMEMKKMLLKRFPDMQLDHIDYLSNLISCHTGPKALGIGCYRVYKK